MDGIITSKILFHLMSAPGWTGIPVSGRLMGTWREISAASDVVVVPCSS